MAFLRTLFWIVLTIVIVIFSANNWKSVTINLFGNLQADAKLPVLMLVAFLLGFIPLYVWHRLTRWHQNKKRIAAERALAAAVSAPAASPMAASPLPEDGTLPPKAD